MKIISLSILTIALSVSSFARENPFEPTDHFLDQKEMMIKANEKEKLKQEQDAINLKAQELENQKLANEIKAQELENQKLAKEIEAQKMLELQKKNEMMAKEKAQIQKKLKESKMVKNKPYIPEIKENFKVLPFVKIFVVNDTLTIKVDKKYKLLNQDILTPDKKLLFDFAGKVSFYTVRKDIISESFKSFAVGTHMEEDFFRIVVDVPFDVINYSENIDSKNNIITIKKK